MRFSKKNFVKSIEDDINYESNVHVFSDTFSDNHEQCARDNGAILIKKEILSDIKQKKFRFKKSNLIKWLEDKAFAIEKDNKFTDKTGWAQVHEKGFKVNREYGRWDEIQSILIDLY